MLGLTSTGSGCRLSRTLKTCRRLLTASVILSAKHRNAHGFLLVVMGSIPGETIWRRLNGMSKFLSFCLRCWAVRL